MPWNKKDGNNSVEDSLTRYLSEKPEMLFPDPDNVVSAKEHIETVLSSIERVSNISLRERIVRLLIRWFGISLVLTFGIFILEGFHFLGFDLENNVLNWLGAATIGELGGLITIVVKSLFR